MPNYYLFEPLMENGEQVVRTPLYGEWYVDPEDYPSFQWVDDAERKQCINGDAAWPILQMKKFDHDPLLKLKETVEMINAVAKRESEEPGYDFLTNVMKPCSLQMWLAISETIKELEAKP